MDHKDFYSELREDLQLVLRRYKTNEQYEDAFAYAFHINNLLRNTKQLSTRWKKEIELLDELTNKIKISEPLKLYRVCNFKELDQFISDKSLVYPAFSSTSTSEKSTFQFLENGDKNALLRISLPKQSNIALMDGMPGETGEENEILLPRNLSFEIEDKNILKSQNKLKNKLGMNVLGVTKLTMLTLVKTN